MRRIPLDSRSAGQMQRARAGRWFLAVIAVALASVIGASAPVGQAAPANCQITNARSQATFKLKNAMQAAVDDALAGDTLTVKGRCVGLVVIDKALSVKGVYVKKLGPATLDGARLGTVLTIEGAKVSLDNLTITGGLVPSGVERRGGGIWNHDGSVTASQLTVTGNIAEDSYNAGGIFNDPGEFYMTSSTISGNYNCIYNPITGTCDPTSGVPSSRSNGTGGAWNDEDSTMSITSSKIFGNRDFGVTFGAGGVRNDGTIELLGNVLSDNSTTGDPTDSGGGMLDTNAQGSTLTKNTFTDNAPNQYLSICVSC